MNEDKEGRLARLLRSTPVVGVVVAAVVLVITLAAIDTSREQAVDRARALVASQAAAVAEHGRQVFVTIDTILEESIADRAQADIPEPVYDPETGVLVNDPDNPAYRHSETLAQRIADYPYIQSVMVIDGDGQVVLASEELTAADLDQSTNREFLDIQRERPGGMVISAPQPALGEEISHFVQVSREIRTEQGRFDGMATARVSLDYFANVYRDIAAAFDLDIALIADDAKNTVLAASFAGSDAVGRALGSFDYFQEPVGYLPGPGAEAIVQRDTGSALLGLQRLDPWPAVIGVALPKGQLFTDWGATTATLVITALAFIGIVAVLSRTMFRQTAQINRLERALENNRANLEHRIKRRSSELKAERDKAIAADKEKSARLQRISQELKTPLTAISGFSEAIEQGLFCQDVPRYRRYAHFIGESSAMMLDNIEEILEASRIASGKYRLNEEKFHLGRVISDAVNSARSYAQPRGIRIDSYLHGPDFQVYGDRRAIRQVILNVVTHAIRSSRANGQVTIKFGLDPAGGGATLSVEDEGQGMSEEAVAEALKSESAQIEADMRSDPGAGFGLGTVKALLELHGGILSIDSREGRGTIVYIQLPPGRIMDVDASV